MAGTKPLYKKYTGGGTPSRNDSDGNSFADINQLQNQIGDLNDLVTDYGDNENDDTANEDLTSFFEDLRSKIIGSSNDSPTRYGKVLEHGNELLPAGLIIMIAGISESSNEDGPIAGLEECPLGYVECKDPSVINSLNSIFYVNPVPGPQKVAPNMADDKFIRGSNSGDNTDPTLAIPYFDSIDIGVLGGEDNHYHSQSHIHSFPHNHDHSHLAPHIHAFTHDHDIEDHIHNLVDHIHSVSGRTLGDTDVSNDAPKMYDRYGSGSDTDLDHRHNFSSNTGLSFVLTVITSPASQSSGSRSPFCHIPTVNSTGAISENTTTKESGQTGDDTNFQSDTNVEDSSPSPRSKIVKFCMKI